MACFIYLSPSVAGSAEFPEANRSPILAFYFLSAKLVV